MIRYFYITIHFFPQYEETIFREKQGGKYQNSENGKWYRKRLLYDFGWGQENGFELLPPLPFENLIQLVEQPQPTAKRFRYTMQESEALDIWRSNLLGAVSVIMQDHTEALIDFLSEKITTDYFADPVIRQNFKWFCFDDSKTMEEGRVSGGILTRSYEEVLNDYPQWKRIAQDVVKQVYG